MEFTEYTRFFLSLAVVLGLIWVCAWLAKRFGLDKKFRGVTAATGRLAVLDTLYLDPKRKLVLVRADAREYVILLAGESVTVIDQLDGKPMRRFAFVLLGLLTVGALVLPELAHAQSINFDAGDGNGSTTGRIVQLILLMTVLSLAPSILMMMTSFMRIVIVLSFVRMAMGTQQTPPTR